MSQRLSRRTVTTITRIALVGALVVLLTACFKIDMDMAVSEDDTIGGTMIFGLEQSVIQLMGGDVDAFFDEAGMAPDVENVTTEEWEEDSFIGRRYTFSGVPLDEFNEDGGEGDELTIVRDGDVFRLNGVLDMSDAAGEDAGDMGFDPEAMLSGAEVRIRVTFPGEVQEANGVIDGNSVTWEPDPSARNELTAVASAVPGGGGSSALPIIIGILVLAAAAVAFFALRRRQAPAPATAGADAAPSTEVTTWGAPDPDLGTTLPPEPVVAPPEDALLDAPPDDVPEVPEVPPLEVPEIPPVEVPEAPPTEVPDVPEVPGVPPVEVPDVPPVEVPEIPSVDVPGEVGETLDDSTPPDEPVTRDDM